MKTCLAITMLMAVTIVATARPAVPRDDDWTDALTALRPDTPLAYLELGEDIADASQTDADRALAMHLFSLAGALDADRLGRSACLALSEYEPDANLRQRWIAMASLLDDEGLVVGDAVEKELASPSTIESLFEAFSYYRRGEGNRAEAELRRSQEAIALIDRFAHVLPGGSARFLADADHYRGGQRPPLRESTVRAMLELEDAVRRGPDRSWAGELLLTEGRPLLDVDPDRLDEALGVDPKRAWWRAGEWVTDPG